LLAPTLLVFAPQAGAAKSQLNSQLRGLRHVAAVEGPYRLHFVDLDTGKDVMIAPASHTGSSPAIGPRGLVYSVNPHFNGPGKLVFVPTARLLADVR
jgi:hypothetical protein